MIDHVYAFHYHNQVQVYKVYMTLDWCTVYNELLSLCLSKAYIIGVQQPRDQFYFHVGANG